MPKIIHLSDLHIKDNETYQAFQNLVSKLIKLYPSSNEYVVVLTGDLVHAAEDGKQIYALLEIQRLKAAGFRVLIVPGNHDYGGTMGINTKYVEPFKMLYFGTSFSYPKTDLIDEVLFIGLDSNYGDKGFDANFEANDYKLGAMGSIGGKQLNELSKILANPLYSSCKKVLYLHHIPFTQNLMFPLNYNFLLTDRNELKNVIESKVDAILSGHVHLKNVAQSSFNGEWGIPRIYNAGSSIKVSKQFGMVRLIDLNTDPSSDSEIII